MNDIDIRRKVLEKLYDIEKKTPGKMIMSGKLINELHIPNEELGFNIRYLHKKGFIDAKEGMGTLYNAIIRINHNGIDLIEDESEFNTKFPLKITNIQNSNGVVIDSNDVTVDVNNSINIENSFNELYELIKDKDNAEEIMRRIKIIETELKKDNKSEIKESTSWVQKNANWIIFPLIQTILNVYGLTLPQ